MKKLCLILVLFSFISVMPCSAKKVIINNSFDRTVPSRCSGHEFFEEVRHIEEYVEENIQEEVIEEPQETTNVEEQNNGLIPGYRATTYETMYKPLLGNDIRPELAGTTWGYPDYSQLLQENQQENIQQEEIIEEENIAQNAENEEVQDVPRFIREAADYHYIDTINRPEDTIPSGVVEEHFQ